MRRKVLIIVLLTILFFILLCLSGPALTGEEFYDETTRTTTKKSAEERRRVVIGASEARANREILILPPEPMGVDVLAKLSFSSHPRHIQDWAARVAWCESRNDPMAYNASSGTSGLYQFTLGTWNAYGEGDVWSAQDQIETVKKMIDILGFEAAKLHWECK